MLFLFIMLVVSATSVFAIEETHKTALKSPIITVDDDAKMYIKDIEITGANVVKPEYILEKMQLHSGDAYNRDLLQTDLKRI